MTTTNQVGSSHHLKGVHGLVLSPDWPHLGASPDGVVACNCCGQGVLEVRCPFCGNDDVEITANPASLEIQTVLHTSTGNMLTTIKCRHKYSFVRQSIVIFVYAHFQTMVHGSLHIL